jgi:glycine/D-amino acid oxidase-like deaminating enzyme
LVRHTTCSFPLTSANKYLGGGIIGCTTAYFLTRHPSYDPAKHKITLLEASKIAGGASGKAGGLLALWAYPSSLVPLSYKLHAELAKEHNGAERWGYRAIHCGQLSAKGQAQKNPTSSTSGAAAQEHLSLQKRDDKSLGRLRAAGYPKDLDWFDTESVKSYDEMGDPSTTAQVHPYQFTTAMAELAEQKGAKVVTQARVTNIKRTSDKVEAVTYKDENGREQTIQTADVVVAAGPWTQRVFPPAPISAMRAHSVTIRPSRPVSAYAIFTEIELPKEGTRQAKRVSPEIYARPNNELYACGEGDRMVPLPETTADVETDLSRCEEIVQHVNSISEELRNGEVLVRQACYLPNVDGPGGPLVGHTGIKGLTLAAGHTCWGIQNGPGTGKLVSEFVFDGDAKSAKIGNLDPRKVL